MTQTNPNKPCADAEYPQPKNNTAFLHLPTELEKEVNAYINKLAKKKNIEWKNDEGVKSLFESQGCFLFIPLEKIEALMKAINTCLSLNEGDMDEIKKNLKQAIDIINGI